MSGAYKVGHTFLKDNFQFTLLQKLLLLLLLLNIKTQKKECEMKRKVYTTKWRKHTQARDCGECVDKFCKRKIMMIIQDGYGYYGYSLLLVNGMQDLLVDCSFAQ